MALLLIFSPLLLTSALLHPVIRLFQTCDWIEISCFFPLGSSQRESLIHRGLFLYLDHSKHSHVYYKWSVGVKKVLFCPARITCWIHTQQQTLTVLSFHHIPPLLNDLFHWACQWLCTPQWHKPMVNPLVACLDWIPVRLHHVATATTNMTSCHGVLHICGILLFANRTAVSDVSTQRKYINIT